MRHNDVQSTSTGGQPGEVLFRCTETKGISDRDPRIGSSACSSVLDGLPEFELSYLIPGVDQGCRFVAVVKLDWVEVVRCPGETAGATNFIEVECVDPSAAVGVQAAEFSHEASSVEW